jgi:hypothetical protein
MRCFVRDCPSGFLLAAQQSICKHDFALACCVDSSFRFAALRNDTSPQNTQEMINFPFRYFLPFRRPQGRRRKNDKSGSKKADYNSPLSKNE